MLVADLRYILVEEEKKRKEKKRKEKKRKAWIYSLLIALLSPQSKAQEEIER